MKTYSADDAWRRDLNFFERKGIDGKSWIWKSSKEKEVQDVKLILRSVSDKWVAGVRLAAPVRSVAIAFLLSRKDDNAPSCRKMSAQTTPHALTGTTIVCWAPWQNRSILYGGCKIHKALASRLYGYWPRSSKRSTASAFDMWRAFQLSGPRSPSTDIGTRKGKLHLSSKPLIVSKSTRKHFATMYQACCEPPETRVDDKKAIFAAIPDAQASWECQVKKIRKKKGSCGFSIVTTSFFRCGMLYSGQCALVMFWGDKASEKPCSHENWAYHFSPKARVVNPRSSVCGDVKALLTLPVIAFDFLRVPANGNR